MLLGAPAVWRVAPPQDLPDIAGHASRSTTHTGKVPMTQRFATDVLVIGGGAAGLSAALRLAGHARVTVLCKGDVASGSSHWAQGGIAAVTDPMDSFDSHVADTSDAGAGLCDQNVVQFTVSRTPPGWGAKRHPSCPTLSRTPLGWGARRHPSFPSVSSTTLW